MDAVLITADGFVHAGDEPTIRRLLNAGTPFWLDLHGPSYQSVPLLRDVFKFHPLAVEAAEQFGQRPKFDDYDEYVLLVLYGAEAADHEKLVELHCFFSEHYLVTVHQRPCADLQAFVQKVGKGLHADRSMIMLLHGVIDALVDSFFPALADFDDDIDELEDEILEKPTDDQLGRLFDMKRSLIGIRKVVTPSRDVLASVVAGVGELPGMTPEAERYFRDIYDHLIRISDLVDSYRDLMSGVLDTHLSTVSNRLNAVMKQLTIIATLFLPLTFLTGFFGQNFAYLVTYISGASQFWIYGVGLELAALLGLLTMFWRRGWLTADDAPRKQTEAPRLGEASVK